MTNLLDTVESKIFNVNWSHCSIHAIDEGMNQQEPRKKKMILSMSEKYSEKPPIDERSLNTMLPL